MRKKQEEKEGGSEQGLVACEHEFSEEEKKKRGEGDVFRHRLFPSRSLLAASG